MPYAGTAVPGSGLPGTLHPSRMRGKRRTRGAGKDTCTPVPSRCGFLTTPLAAHKEPIEYDYSSEDIASLRTLAAEVASHDVNVVLPEPSGDPESELLELARVFETVSENASFEETKYAIAHDDSAPEGHRLLVSVLLTTPFGFDTLQLDGLCSDDLLFGGLSDGIKDLGLRFLKAFCTYHGIDTLRESPLVENIGDDVVEYLDVDEDDAEQMRTKVSETVDAAMQSSFVDMYASTDSGDIEQDLLAFVPSEGEAPFHALLVEGIPFLHSPQFISMDTNNEDYGGNGIDPLFRVFVVPDNSIDGLVDGVLQSLECDGYYCADAVAQVEYRIDDAGRQSVLTERTYAETLFSYIHRLSRALASPLDFIK